MPTEGPATQAKVDEVVAACERYGASSVIALAGVPGTGKSHIALIAAQTVASDPLMVRELQFHPSVTYDTFIEGLRIDATGATVSRDGAFLEWNERAHADPEHIYVLLIEEFTRADVSAVLGDLLTYLEYRDRYFLTLYSARPVRVAENLRILATYNPTDRSALNLDQAMLRRLRVISFPPDPDQLEEMLAGRPISSPAVDSLVAIFEDCKAAFPDDYADGMPFGHGIFAQVEDEQPDLNDLWNERIIRLLQRPLLQPHQFSDVIRSAYPWIDPAYKAE
jgi:5-methylcytosine-specific restriction endonuclease McrBC GTP-binding regulatory subunit McrB